MSALPASALRQDDDEAALARRHDGLSRHYTLEPDTLLKRQAARESNARSYPRRIPLALQRAKGLYVEDTRGARRWPMGCPCTRSTSPPR